MCHHDIASVDRKAAQRDMRTVGDRLNNFCNRLHLVGHGPWSRWTRVFWKGEEAIRTETRTQADLLTCSGGLFLKAARCRACASRS